jgi:hypothetical protein
VIFKNFTIFVQMKVKQYIKKVSIVALLVMGIQVAYAALSFTGIADEKLKTTKFSLKNLSTFSHKSLSFSSLKSSLQYKGLQSVSKENNSGSETSSMLRFDNGNTSFVYPYKFKVKAPKFKTPAPPQH